MGAERGYPLCKEGGKMKILSVDGRLVELLKPEELYLALYKKDGFWTISGVMYRNADEIPSNLSEFCPDDILIVKIKIPMEQRGFVKTENK